MSAGESLLNVCWSLCLESQLECLLGVSAGESLLGIFAQIIGGMSAGVFAWNPSWSVRWGISAECLLGSPC
ncbi:hypothetical protein [Fibrobacter sp. UWH6]|uniref:hypothetical protein n=1 Tax=Fibrobacter sp. (strain UWH6) TaxID=1896212 RepID=UPI0009323C16|nr:hypothetical protein [Fibrobacter sp. UWH6]